jgi:hypothetical protein
MMKMARQSPKTNLCPSKPTPNKSKKKRQPQKIAPTKPTINYSFVVGITSGAGAAGAGGGGGSKILCHP